MYNWSISVSFFIYSYHFLLLYLCVQCTYYSIYVRKIENMPFENRLQQGSHWNTFLEIKNFSFTAISVYKTRILLFALIKIRLNGKEWKRFPILNPIWYLFKIQYILCWLKVFFRKRFYICHHHQMNQPHPILLLLN